MKRHATPEEQEVIDHVNKMLSEIGLVVTELQPSDKNGHGAVIPTKGF